MTQCPLHEKAVELQTHFEAINGFIEWLQLHEMTVCGFDEYGNYTKIRESYKDLVLRSFEIDPNEFEKEKQMMLSDVQRLAKTN